METKNLHQDIRKLKEQSDDSVISRNKICEQRGVLRDTLKECSRRNKEIYGNSSEDGAKNELNYVHHINLMLNVPAIKGFEPPHQPAFSTKPLADTAELVYATSHEMRKVSQVTEELRQFIGVSKGQPERLRAGLRLISRLEAMSSGKLRHEQKFVDKRSSLALKAFLMPPSLIRMRDLDAFDRSMTMFWRERALNLKKACVEMTQFIRKSLHQ